METKSIIHQLFEQEFIHELYATTLVQYLNHKVDIPELKQLLKHNGEIDQTHQSHFLPATPTFKYRPAISEILHSDSFAFKAAY